MLYASSMSCFVVRFTRAILLTGPSGGLIFPQMATPIPPRVGLIEATSKDGKSAPDESGSSSTGTPVCGGVFWLNPDCRGMDLLKSKPSLDQTWFCSVLPGFSEIGCPLSMFLEAALADETVEPLIGEGKELV
jgi:hypothetical protein